MDRVKESMFGMIQNNIKDSVCLDLFAGSGSLGIEALSNGSRKCYFVDHDKNTIKTLKDNIRMLNVIDQSIIMHQDYQRALNYFATNHLMFDLIFIDPPYKYQKLNDIIQFIDQYNLLTLNGQVVGEYEFDDPKPEIGALEIDKLRVYGSTKIVIYRHRKNAVL